MEEGTKEGRRSKVLASPDLTDRLTARKKLNELFAFRFFCLNNASRALPELEVGTAAFAFFVFSVS